VVPSALDHGILKLTPAVFNYFSFVVFTAQIGDSQTPDILGLKVSSRMVIVAVSGPPTPEHAPNFCSEVLFMAGACSCVLFNPVLSFLPNR